MHIPNQHQWYLNTKCQFHVKWMMQIKNCISNWQQPDSTSSETGERQDPSAKKNRILQVNVFSAYSTFRTKERGELLEEPDTRWVAKR